MGERDIYIVVCGEVKINDTYVIWSMGEMISDYLNKGIVLILHALFTYNITCKTSYLLHFS